MRERGQPFDADTFSAFKLSNAVKLTHVMLHSLACDTTKFGCFPERDLVKQPVHSAACSKHPRLVGPSSLIKVRGERVKRTLTLDVLHHTVPHELRSDEQHNRMPFEGL